MITNEEVYAIADHVRNQSEKYKSWKRKNIDVLAPLKEMYGAGFEDTTIVITPDSVQDFANVFCDYYTARMDAIFSEGFFIAMEMIRDGKIKITRRESKSDALPPKTVQSGQQVYDGYDVIGDFLKDHCDMDATRAVSRRELYFVFCKWHKNKYGDRPMSDRSFYQVMRNRGFTCIHKADDRYYIGIGWKVA